MAKHKVAKGARTWKFQRVKRTRKRKKPEQQARREIRPQITDRFVVFSMAGIGTAKKERRPPCSRAVYTSYDDAAKATVNCARSPRNPTHKPCFLEMGLPGMEKLVGRCQVKGLKVVCEPPRVPDDAKQIIGCTAGQLTKAQREERKAYLAKESERRRKVEEDAIKRQLWISRQGGAGARGMGSLGKIKTRHYRVRVTSPKRGRSGSLCVAAENPDDAKQIVSRNLRKTQRVSRVKRGC